MNKDLYVILCYYLKKTGTSFDKNRLKQLLYSHPEHNSLYAMVDVLDELRLENIALRTDMHGLLANGFPVMVRTYFVIGAKYIYEQDRE
jgi:hypothetical protein